VKKNYPSIDQAHKIIREGFCEIVCIPFNTATLNEFAFRSGVLSNFIGYHKIKYFADEKYLMQILLEKGVVVLKNGLQYQTRDEFFHGIRKVLTNRSEKLISKYEGVKNG